MFVSYGWVTWTWRRPQLWIVACLETSWFPLVRWSPVGQWAERRQLSLLGFHWPFWEPNPWSRCAALQGSAGTNTHRHTDTQTTNQWIQRFIFNWLSCLSVLSGSCSPEWPPVDLLKVPSLYALCCVRHLQVPLLQCSERLLVMVMIIQWADGQPDLSDGDLMIYLTLPLYLSFPSPPSQSPGPVAACKTIWLWGDNKGVFSQAVAGPFTSSWTATCGQKTPFLLLTQLSPWYRSSCVNNVIVLEGGWNITIKMSNETIHWSSTWEHFQNMQPHV